MRKEGAKLDMVKESLRLFFVVGVVVIPILYWLSGKAAKPNKDRVRKEKEYAGRERLSTEHGASTGTRSSKTEPLGGGRSR